MSALFLLLYETLDNGFIKHNDWIEELVWSGIWDGAWTSTAFPTSKPAARPAEAHVCRLSYTVRAAIRKRYDTST